MNNYDKGGGKTAKKKVEAKTKAIKMTTEVKEAQAVPWSSMERTQIKSKEPKKAKELPQSDMWNIYRAMRTLLEGEDLTVNDKNPMQMQVRIEKDDFVEDCMSMIPSRIGAPPEYPAWNFPAVIHCIVPKGDNTATRLSILKDVVRKALIREPIVMGLVRLSFIVTSEENSRALGVRMSAISLLIRVERIKKQRW